MHARLDWKLALIYTLLVLQVLVFMIYVASTPHEDESSATSSSSTHKDSVSFVDLHSRHASNASRGKSSGVGEPHRLGIIQAETWLRDARTSTMFKSFNGTFCWDKGVNQVLMQRGSSQQRCICDSGWHGVDCGQPEVVWRAIMASKQMAKLRRRKYARRILHIFQVDDHNSALAEVIVEELYPVVDIFVVCDTSTAEDNFRHKLVKGFLAKQQDKILYVNVGGKSLESPRVLAKYVWKRVKKSVRNIRDDDIYVTTDPEQILNSRALMFLKLYDGWPQPIGFRLRWCIFGFFWQHPQRTSIALGASTVGLMRELQNRTPTTVATSQQQQQIDTNEMPQEREHLGLVIGDLNHYGGWYCQFCQGPANVISALRQKSSAKIRELLKLQVDPSAIDVSFVEELIGSGMWFDEKTNLLRASRSRESYYAPEIVMNQTWKYDWLVENFYAKLDYY
ncbi:hypothetical protein TKK_0010849 [Trichogramma kaykai]